MARDDGKSSIDFAELARLLAGGAPAPTPAPTSAKVAAAAPKTPEAAESPTLTNVKAAAADSKFVTNWRSGLKAKKGTKLGDLYEKQNQERAIRDAAFAAKPTEDPGPGNKWVWQERNQKWAKVSFGTPGAGGGDDTGVDGDSTIAPVGTPPAFVYNSVTGKWEMPPKPTDPGSWVWDNIKGWVNTTVNPGSTGFGTEGGPTLAKDTFKNTLALFFGAGEMSQGWVDSLYKVVSGYVYTGSTIDEALNLSLQDVRNNPALTPFTKRFQGLYALQDRLAKGEAIEVPTIAEFFKSESAMGDVLRSAGLGELATQDFLGDVLGRGKSVLEVTNLIDSTFKAIDNAPSALKADLQTYFPGVDRTAIAKALLTGKEGWQELDRKVRGISVLSAAKSQGINVNLASATDIADLGYDYTGALAGFETVKRLERGKMLGEISGMQFGQEEAVGATFRQDAKAKQQIDQLAALEQARFAGSSGRLASRSRAQGAF